MSTMHPTAPDDGGRTPREALEEALYEIKRVIVGQDAMLERLLVALLAGGHVLLEGVPGLAKTLTVRRRSTLSALNARPPDSAATFCISNGSGGTGLVWLVPSRLRTVIVPVGVPSATV